MDVVLSLDDRSTVLCSMVAERTGRRAFGPDRGCLTFSAVALRSSSSPPTPRRESGGQGLIIDLTGAASRRKVKADIVWTRTYDVENLHPLSPRPFSRLNPRCWYAPASHLLLFMSNTSPKPDGPEQHTLFRYGPDGRLKSREIWDPTDETRERHAEILKAFREVNIPMPNAFGGVRGKSLRDNVEPHRGHEAFYMLDIKDAYASVDTDHLREQADRALRQKHRGQNLRTKVDDFIANDAVIPGVPGLPLGYPASPYLFNLYCREMDGRLTYALSGLPWEGNSAVSYTRWLDDLTFSGPQRSLTAAKRRLIREIVEETPGFEPEPRKTKNYKLGRGAVTITGLSVYPDGRITPAPALLEKVVKAFDEAEGILDSGGELDEKALGKLHGHNSVLHMAGAPERSGSKFVRGLTVRYDDISRRSLGMRVA